MAAMNCEDCGRRLTDQRIEVAQYEAIVTGNPHPREDTTWKDATVYAAMFCSQRCIGRHFTDRADRSAAPEDNPL